MLLRPGPGEPAVTTWRSQPLRTFARELVGDLSGRRQIVAVDGRSGGGKSTLARRLASVIEAAAVVSTDDVAWNESMFGWAQLLIDGVLRPFSSGRVVRYRPPAWQRHDRPGAIDVPGHARILLIEGVGASQQVLADHLEAAIWVQSDFAEAERRGIARDVASGVNGDEAASVAFWQHWMAEEIPFLIADQPWARADVIVAGTRPDAAPDDDDVIVSSDPTSRTGGAVGKRGRRDGA